MKHRCCSNTPIEDFDCLLVCSLPCVSIVLLSHCLSRPRYRRTEERKPRTSTLPLLLLLSKSLLRKLVYLLIADLDREEGSSSLCESFRTTLLHRIIMTFFSPSKDEEERLHFLQFLAQRSNSLVNEGMHACMQPEVLGEHKPTNKMLSFSIHALTLILSLKDLYTSLFFPCFSFVLSFCLARASSLPPPCFICFFLCRSRYPNPVFLLLEHDRQLLLLQL